MLLLQESIAFMQTAWMYGSLQGTSDVRKLFEYIIIFSNTVYRISTCEYSNQNHLLIILGPVLDYLRLRIYGTSWIFDPIRMHPTSWQWSGFISFECNRICIWKCIPIVTYIYSNIQNIFQFYSVRLRRRTRLIMLNINWLDALFI